MQVSTERFGSRGKPGWDQADLDMHLRLGQALIEALGHYYSVTGNRPPAEHRKSLKFDVALWRHMLSVKDNKGRAKYFTDYALRITNVYAWVLNELEECCGWEFSVEITPGGYYRIRLKFDDQEYGNSHLCDYMACASWVIQRINNHIEAHR